MLESHWVIFQSHTATMHCFLKILWVSSDILCIAIIGMTFNIYLFISHVPKCIFNMLCLILLVYNSFFSIRVGFRPEIYIAYWGEQWLSVWHPSSCARRRGLGNTSEWSLLWQNTNIFKQWKYWWHGVGFFCIPFRWHTTMLTQIQSVFLHNYVTPHLMNMAFRPRHRQSEISVCSEI